jgi:hypothetical protein
MISRAATLRQQQGYEAVVRTGGTVAAARELGISVTTLCNLVKLYYCERSNVPYPAGMVRRDGNGGRGRVILAEIVLGLEAAVKGIQEGEQRREALLEEVLAQVRELNARAPVLLVGRYATHRRQIDGGEGGKRERGERR